MDKINKKTDNIKASGQTLTEVINVTYRLIFLNHFI
jgi:hypothetical protein